MSLSIITQGPIESCGFKYTLSKPQDPTPRLIIITRKYHCYLARMLSTTPAMKCRRCMAFVKNQY